MTTTMINIGNGRTAISFVPEDSKELAIVHLSVIKKLAELLPIANEIQIIEGLKQRLSNSQNMGEYGPGRSLEDAITVCNEFTAFHETVNLIRAYEPVKSNLQAAEGRLDS